ncbi:MAG: hypothetical protein JO308_11160, partial [Verrucomicrobia bacterium]|nr:hypothetical protein [Verrucomicrobiota bacterium]
MKRPPSEEAEPEIAEGRTEAQRIARLAKEAEDRRRGPATALNTIVTRASHRLYRVLGNVPRPVSRVLRTLLNSLRQESGHGDSLGSSGRARSLDLFDDDAVLAAAGRPREHILWTPQSPDTINTTWSAARFCIDLLRNRAELRQRFPHALSDGGSGGFAGWITTDGGDEFRLSESARLKIKEAFERTLSARARQIFFARPDVRAAYPLGLTPPGRRDLFRWFICFGQIEHGLRLEE